MDSPHNRRVRVTEATDNNSAPQNNLMDSQIHHQNQLLQNQPGNLQIQESASFINEINSNEQILEHYIETHWERNGALMIEQSRNFNVASLLSSLYKLKTENVDLANELTVLTRRRDKLLAMREQCPLLTSQNDNNPAPSSTTNTELSSFDYNPNFGNTGSVLQIHSTPNKKHPVHHLSNNIPSHVNIQRSIVQEPRSDNRRQVDQNVGVFTSNTVYQTVEQESNIAACYICKGRAIGVTSNDKYLACKKSGCKLGFHVICAQNAGLPYKRPGKKYKYDGYCTHHYSKKINKQKYLLQNQPQNFSSELTIKMPENPPFQNISTNSQTSNQKQKSIIYNNFGDQITNGNKVEFTHPPENSIISIETKVENRSLTSKKLNHENPEAGGIPITQYLSKYQKIKNAMRISKSKDGKNSNDEPINLTNMPTNTLTKKSDIISSLNNNKQVLKTKDIDNNGSDYVLDLSTNRAKHMINTENNLMAPQIHYQNRNPQNQPEESQIQESISSSVINGMNGSPTEVLKKLLEEHWEEGGAYMLEQAKNFDVSSMLTCLYELKSTNVELEDKLVVLARRRDYLLANNRQPEIPLYDSTLQQNHSMSNNRFAVHHSPNNLSSQIVIRAGVFHEPRSEYARQIDQNMNILRSNPLYQIAAQQSPNMTWPYYQPWMDDQPNRG